MMTYKLANRVLEGLCGLSSMIASGIYIGLSTTPPARDGTGFTEPSGGVGYKRVLLGMSGQSTSQRMNTATRKPYISPRQPVVGARVRTIFCSMLRPGDLFSHSVH